MVMVLLTTGNLLLPFQRMTTLKGRMASVGGFFEDPQVIRILRKHNLRVQIVWAGSRELAMGSLNGYDFVFPSGQSAASQIYERHAHNGYSNDYRPFNSPLTLASFREYAETLVDAGVAVPQPTPQGEKPLYYWLDMHKFLRLTERSRTWNALGIARHGVRNGNLVLANTSDICQSNSADSYLGLVAFIRNGNAVPKDSEAAQSLARKIKPLLVGQGSPGTSAFLDYKGSGGRNLAPIAVAYEHQFLAYQDQYLGKHHRIDDERVLLYPRPQMMSQPQFIALNPEADPLGELLEQDTELRHRATQLGYQLTDTDGTDKMKEYLRVRDLPAPQTSGRDQTAAKMPDLPMLEKMIATVKDCPEVVSD